MMPLAPQLSVPHLGQVSALPKIRNEMKACKPKLSFSIDSIVGKRKTLENNGKNSNETDLFNNETDLLTEKAFKRRLSDSLENPSQNDRHSVSPQSAGRRTPPEQSISPISNSSFNGAANVGTNADIGSPRLSPLSLVTNNNNNTSPNNISNNNNSNNTTNTNNNNNTQPPNSLADVAHFLNRSSLANNNNNNNNNTSTTAATSVSSVNNNNSLSPTPLSGQLPQVASMGHTNHSMMVAAAAAAAAASSAHQFPTMPSDYQHAAAFYPWFLRANPFGRFPGMPFETPLGTFLLPPFRKPKRIRTAFSPGQLLKLEQAFEKNHYVVGNERKQLANHLGLSETQVKVWFQNRRTKHKRQKQEDEESGSGSITNGDNGNVNKDYSDDEEEEIDLDDEDCGSDEQEPDHHHNPHSQVPMAAHTNPNNNAATFKFANMHHLWYQSAINAGLMANVDHPPVTSPGSN